MISNQWKIYNHSGSPRILVTKMLPGDRWLDMLKKADYRIEVCTSAFLIKKDALLEKIGSSCAGVIGQLTEQWDNDLFQALHKAGGKVYCNYAVGYDNVDVQAATQKGIAVGNTPGVLTETTAEMAVALTLACARRIVEADKYIRSGQYKGWLPNLYLGERLKGQTVGIVGAGRIGSAYAIMMTAGFKMNLIYFSRSENEELEQEVVRVEDSLTVERAVSLTSLLEKADIVSLHTPLNKDTQHLIGAEQLSLMKDNAILINSSRGPVIDEVALSIHCKKNKDFKAGLDVFENEPSVNDDLKKLKNITLAPHLGSASGWTREAMALLASLNIKGVLEEYPIWKEENITDFLDEQPPKAIPSIVNTEVIPTY